WMGEVEVWVPKGVTSNLEPLTSSAWGVWSVQVNLLRKDDPCSFGPILAKSHISRIRRPRLAINSTQPSKRWENPSDAPCPYHSTSTPIIPIRKPFTRTDMGMDETTRSTRFHIRSLKR